MFLYSQLIVLLFLAQYYVSCEESRMLNPIVPSVVITIDIDDSGPLEPFEVTCLFEG